MKTNSKSDITIERDAEKPPLESNSDAEPISPNVFASISKSSVLT